MTAISLKYYLQGKIILWWCHIWSQRLAMSSNNKIEKADECQQNRLVNISSCFVRLQPLLRISEGQKPFRLHTWSCYTTKTPEPPAYSCLKQLNYTLFTWSLSTSDPTGTKEKKQALTCTDALTELKMDFESSKARLIDFRELQGAPTHCRNRRLNISFLRNMTFFVFLTEGKGANSKKIIDYVTPSVPAG